MTFEKVESSEKLAQLTFQLPTTQKFLAMPLSSIFIPIYIVTRRFETLTSLTIALSAFDWICSHEKNATISTLLTIKIKKSFGMLISPIIKVFDASETIDCRQMYLLVDLLKKCRRNGLIVMVKPINDSKCIITI